MMIQPLDLQTLFVNIFAGSMTLFIGIALLVIASLSARFKMPSIIFGMIFVLFSIFMMSSAPWLYFISILLVGLLIDYVIMRLVKN